MFIFKVYKIYLYYIGFKLYTYVIVRSFGLKGQFEWFSALKFELHVEGLRINILSWLPLLWTPFNVPTTSGTIISTKGLKYVPFIKCGKCPGYSTQGLPWKKYYCKVLNIIHKTWKWVQVSAMVTPWKPDPPQVLETWKQDLKNTKKYKYFRKQIF